MMIIIHLFSISQLFRYALLLERNIFKFFYLRSWSGLCRFNIIWEELAKYNVIVVCPLMPSLWINDDYQTFVFHHSFIAPRSAIGAVIVVHYILARSTIHFSPRSHSGLSQKHIITEEVIKYNMTVVYQVMPSLAINDDYQMFFFHYLLIILHIIVSKALVVRNFLTKNTFLYTSHREVGLDSVL